MIDRAKSAVKTWALEFARCHGDVRDPDALRMIYFNERHASNPIRRAMAALDYPLFVTALINYQSEAIAREKVKQASALACEEISRRGYFDKLDRVHHFIAGRVFEQDDVAA